MATPLPDEAPSTSLKPPVYFCQDTFLRGSVCEQWVQCGRPGCRCADSDERHGPYFYHFWREKGRLFKRYLRTDEVEATRRACERGAALRKELSQRRAQLRQSQQQARALHRQVQAVLDRQ